MAITVFFKGGGGAGLHYALNPDNAAQWLKLASLVAGEEIEGIQIETDLGLTTGGQGWWVKYNNNVPDISDIPISRKWLQAWYVKQLEGQSEENREKILNRDGWWCDLDAIQNWFTAKFGCKAMLDPEKNPSPKQV